MSDPLAQAVSDMFKEAVKLCANSTDHLQARIKCLETAIRKHRDSWLNGDDKCWKDNEELYKTLPEGFEPPERDEFVEIGLCQRYIASCHHPDIEYVSPQRRIEELEAEEKRLRVYALRWEAIQEMLSGTAVQDGNERLWTIRTPLAPERVYRNHMTEFRASVDVYMKGEDAAS